MIASDNKDQMIEALKSYIEIAKDEYSKVRDVAVVTKMNNGISSAEVSFRIDRPIGVGHG